VVSTEVELAARVDIHSHVLPGIDDGARDLETALALLAAAAADGTRTIVATPHSAACDGLNLPERVDALRAAAGAAGLDITVLAGSEVRFSSDLAERFAAGRLVTLNGTAYVLLELPLQGELSPYLQRAFFDLQVAGALPILAHVERYPAVQRDPAVLLDLARQGVLLQVNADSLTGGAGRRAREAAEHLARLRLVHVVASDAHDLRGRPPVLRPAYERLARVTSPEYAAWVEQTPLQIVRGEVVTAPEPHGEERRFRFGSLLTRMTGR
jgi:protein-tyrosine phosphatase